MDQTRTFTSKPSSHYTTPFGDLAPCVHDVYLELLEEVWDEARGRGDVVSRSRVVDWLLDLHPLAPSSSVKTTLEGALVTVSRRDAMLATEVEGIFDGIRLVALTESAFDHLTLTAADQIPASSCDRGVTVLAIS